MNNDWRSYYKIEKPPSPLLIEALGYLRSKNLKALDAGCGAMQDTWFLIKNGFVTLAFDSSPIVREIARKRHMRFVEATFEEFFVLPKSYDLISAQFSLPFIHPKKFNEVFEVLKNSLNKKGIFTGHFFGKKDSWSDNPDMTFHTMDEVKKLLEPLEVLKLEEVEYDGNAALGENKHWHFYEVIARK